MEKRVVLGLNFEFTVTQRQGRVHRRASCLQEKRTLATSVVNLEMDFVGHQVTEQRNLSAAFIQSASLRTAWQVL